VRSLPFYCAEPRFKNTICASEPCQSVLTEKFDPAFAPDARKQNDGIELPERAVDPPKEGYCRALALTARPDARATRGVFHPDNVGSSIKPPKVRVSSFAYLNSTGTIFASPAASMR